MRSGARLDRIAMGPAPVPETHVAAIRPAAVASLAARVAFESAPTESPTPTARQAEPGTMTHPATPATPPPMIHRAAPPPAPAAARREREDETAPALAPIPAPVEPVRPPPRSPITPRVAADHPAPVSAFPGRTPEAGDETARGQRVGAGRVAPPDATRAHVEHVAPAPSTRSTSAASVTERRVAAVQVGDERVREIVRVIETRTIDARTPPPPAAAPSQPQPSPPLPPKPSPPPTLPPQPPPRADGTAGDLARDERKPPLPAQPPVKAETPTKKLAGGVAPAPLRATAQPRAGGAIAPESRARPRAAPRIEIQIGTIEIRTTSAPTAREPRRVAARTHSLAPPGGR